MDGLVLDFDGVLVDSEPIHLRGFQRVLEPLGVNLKPEDYYGRYLGFDDYECLTTALRDNGVSFSDPQIHDLIAAKTAMVKQALAESARPLPGVVELIRAARDAAVPVAVCSSALREEIELVAHALGVLDLLAVIVAAEDVPKGKPDSACYRLTLKRLSEVTGRQLIPGRCVAVEDSPFGIDAAHGAGMKAIAVTSSYAAADLQAADRVVESLADVTLRSLEELL